MTITHNRMAIIIAVSMVSAIGGLVFTMMPLLLVEVEKTFSLSTKALGGLSFWAGAGFLTGTLTAPFWVERVNWRIAAMVIVAFVVGAFCLAAQASGSLLFVAFTGYAFFCAQAIALAMRVLADMPMPERAYGVRLTVELSSIGLFLIIFPIWFTAKGGLSGGLYGLALFAVILGLGSFFMPKRSESKAASKVKGFPPMAQAATSWKYLLIFLVYLVANVGLYFFLGVIVAKFEPSAEQFSLMFSVLKFLGGGAGAVGAIIGVSLGLRVPHFMSGAILVLGVLGLILAPDFKTFMVASWVWEFGFTLGCLYLTAAIVRNDPSNKLVVLVPMVFGIATMIGGVIAGNLLSRGSDMPLYAFVVIASLLPTAFIVLSNPETKPESLT